MKTYGSDIKKWVEALNNERPYYLVVIDAEGYLTFANSPFYSSFQAIPRPEMRNRFFDLVHESDRPALNKVIECCSLYDEAVTTEIRIKSGHFKWVRWEISGIRNPENMSGKFLCLGYDVPKEEQREKTLRAFAENYLAGNALFHSFMENIRSITWIVDEEGILMFGNRSFLEYFRLDESAFGKELTSILPAPIADILSQKHAGVLRSGKRNSGIFSSPADGGGQIYHITVFPVRGSTPVIMAGGEANCL